MDKKKMEYIPLFLDFNETTQDLSDEQCGRLIRALVNYVHGEEIELEGMELLAFRFMKGAIDRNDKLSAIRAEAGAKGGKQTQANAIKNKQTEAKESKITNKNNNNNQEQKQEQDIRFARFWAVYPRKVAKPDARKKFDKLNPDDELLEVMIQAVERQKQSDQWTKDGGQFIPHPATWINQRRWEDEQPVKVLPAQGFLQRDYSDVDREMISELGREMAAFMKGAG